MKLRWFLERTAGLTRYLTGGIAKSFTGLAKNLVGAAKDATGVVKDVTGVRKDLLEIENLEKAKNLVVEATFDQTGFFDHRIQLLERTVEAMIREKAHGISKKNLTVILALIMLGSVARQSVDSTFSTPPAMACVYAILLLGMTDQLRSRALPTQRVRRLNLLSLLATPKLRLSSHLASRCFAAVDPDLEDA
jgi:hypothetical protein